MRSIAWISEKGGTGKTTCAINSAVGLAKRGARVLLVDTDPQANAGLVLLEGHPPSPPTLAAVLLDAADATEAIRPTRTPGLDILPADVSLADAGLALASLIGRESRLRTALAEVEDRYDFIIVDTSPTRSLLTINALVFVREVFIPVEPGLFSLAGVGQLQSAIDDVRRYLGNSELRVAGLVLTRTRRDNVSRDVEAQVRGAFGGLVAKTTIPTSAKVEEAHGRFVSVLDYAPTSAGARAYAALIEEIADGWESKRARASARKPAATDNAA
jgi:chromosome partitioning protein